MSKSYRRIQKRFAELWQERERTHRELVQANARAFAATVRAEQAEEGLRVALKVIRERSRIEFNMRYEHPVQRYRVMMEVDDYVLMAAGSQMDALSLLQEVAKTMSKEIVRNAKAW